MNALETQLIAALHDTYSMLGQCLPDVDGEKHERGGPCDGFDGAAPVMSGVEIDVFYVTHIGWEHRRECDTGWYWQIAFDGNCHGPFPTQDSARSNAAAVLS